jgi:hypothetical protein
MTSKARNLVLTKSQAACLIALRRRKDSKPEIAIQAKLDLTKTATELGALARIGLARQNQSKRWHTTTSGKACRFKIVPDRRGELRRNAHQGPLNLADDQIWGAFARPSARWCFCFGSSGQAAQGQEMLVLHRMSSSSHRLLQRLLVR